MEKKDYSIPIFLICFSVIAILISLSAQGLDHFIPFLQKIVFENENLLFFPMNITLIEKKAFFIILSVVFLIFLYYMIFTGLIILERNEEKKEQVIFLLLILLVSMSFPSFLEMEMNKKKKIRARLLLLMALVFFFSTGLIFLNYIKFSDKEIRYHKLIGLFEEKYGYDAVSSVTITSSIETMWRYGMGGVSRRNSDKYFAPHLYLKINDNEIDIWQNGFQESKEDIIKVIDLIKKNTNVDLKVEDNFSEEQLLLKNREDKNDVIEIFQYAKKISKKK